MKVYALWHGGSSYAAPEYSDLEVFDSLADFKAEFLSRLSNSYYPCVTEESPDMGGPSAWVFLGTKPEDGDLYPDRVAYFGPRGGFHLDPA